MIIKGLNYKKQICSVCNPSSYDLKQNKVKIWSNILYNYYHFKLLVIRTSNNINNYSTNYYNKYGKHYNDNSRYSIQISSRI